jgi:hypothetical protein
MSTNWIIDNVKLQNVKVFLPHGETRRFKLNLPISLSQLLESCIELVPLGLPFERRKPTFTYQDDEDDWVTCDSENEFFEMMSNVKNMDTLRMKITCRQQFIHV